MVMVKMISFIFVVHIMLEADFLMGMEPLLKDQDFLWMKLMMLQQLEIGLLEILMVIKKWI